MFQVTFCTNINGKLFILEFIFTFKKYIDMKKPFAFANLLMEKPDKTLEAEGNIK